MPREQRPTTWIDAFWADLEQDEDEDVSLRAYVNEHGWFCVELEPGRDICLRPGTVLSVIAGAMS